MNLTPDEDAYTHAHTLQVKVRPVVTDTTSTLTGKKQTVHKAAITHQSISIFNP